MRSRVRAAGRAVLCGLVFAAAVALQLPAQNNPHERVYPQSKSTVEKALTALQPNLAGRLPTLDGFATPGEHPLDRYQRAYFQSTVQVSSTPSGGSIVRVRTKVTAWYADPVAAHSGYQLLISNGRLEADFLDQLGDQLARIATDNSGPPASVPAPKPPDQPVPAEPSISAPAAKFPETERTFSSSLSRGLATEERERTSDKSTNVASKSDSSLQAEADTLEEILKNQAHPKNLVAVKKSGTPVVSSPSLNAKPQFLASMHDEFEMLDFNADWVHVRISGLSRGWIWRNSVEMPEGITNSSSAAAPGLTPAADLFHVAREEIAPFPGDWEPLRGKNVKILSVQQVDENSAKVTAPKSRLEYTKFLLEKSYKEISRQSPELAGIVVIFDSADGGMIAATMATLQQWRAGTLSDSALWHKCFFDPPETFESSGSSASQ